MSSAEATTFLGPGAPEHARQKAVRGLGGDLFSGQCLVVNWSEL